MKTIFTMLYSPAGGTMHLCASAVHRDKEESLWQCDHRIVTNQLQQEQFLQIATTKILFPDVIFRQKESALALQCSKQQRLYESG